MMLPLAPMTPDPDGPTPPASTMLSTRLQRGAHVAAAVAHGGLLAALVVGSSGAAIVATVGVGMVTVLLLVRQRAALDAVTAEESARANAAADARLAALVRQGSDLVTVIDADAIIRFASPSHELVLGVAPDALLGQRLLDEIHPEDRPFAARVLDRLLAGDTTREVMEVRLRHASGLWHWIEAVGSNQLGDPAIGGLVFNSRDITDRKRLEAQLVEQAVRDPLTGLGNRRLFADRVGHALARRARHGRDVAIIVLDLDHFKLVNDTLGHARGDALLVAVGARLQAVMRAGDTIARLGGDEFAILLDDLESRTEAVATADRLRDALTRPFVIGERELFVGASLGIAWATPGQTVDDLVTEADLAMYGAKSQGRGRVEQFSVDMRQGIAARLDLEADIRHAIEREEFTLAYQPVVDLQTGCISGAEALVRWEHPTKGCIAPADFIGAAEESGLITDIGRLLLHYAVRDLARFRASGATTLRVAINVSARQLLTTDVAADVAACLQAAGVPGSAMAVELTESVLAANESLVIARLQALRDLGLRVALDDFGTGYSSLAYLSRFPIDVLKIDKSFIIGAAASDRSNRLTRAIVGIGEGLGMRTVAEGIENNDQLETLRAMGCSLGQGYFFSHPVDAATFEALLLTWDPMAYRRPEALDRLLLP
ncbi:MAG: EAL domain-containing protein [Gemmatimonadaceae bacterium]|jgi:diguanylate cyclase (GGDEF)-like protein/PAS domain S-box-containing protein|nr:EAL domain-containing protein [Gemmatimonadaceae bacterium]